MIGTKCKDVSVIEGREGIIASFEDNLSLNTRLKNPVGHVSLNFHANDADKIDDARITEITRKYMARMGIVDTPYIVVRHFDKDYPHCHIVYCRIDNHGETISDKNYFERNRKTCFDLAKEYGLHISESKRQTNVNRLRGNKKIRYEIFNAVDAALRDNSVNTIAQFETKLKAVGVGIKYKFKRGTNEVQGLWYPRKCKRFPASKIDRRFSYANISAHLARKKPLHPQSQWLYVDATIVPIKSYKGGKLTQAQINDYVSCNTVRLDGCQGDYSTLYIKFNPFRLCPSAYTSNPDAVQQIAHTPSQGAGITLSSPSLSGSPTPHEGFAHGNGLPDDFKLWLSRHPGMTIEEALHRFREEQKAKQRRRQGPQL